MTEAFNGLALGTATNLIKGYAPGWDPSRGMLDILHRPGSSRWSRKRLSPPAAGATGDIR